MARARLKRGIDVVKLANRIEALKMQEDEEEDVPADPIAAADQSISHRHGSTTSTSSLAPPEHEPQRKRSLGKLAKSAIILSQPGSFPGFGEHIDSTTFEQMGLVDMRSWSGGEECSRPVSAALLPWIWRAH
ncbi:Calcium/calmodulin-dependent protein kinase cmkA [Fulvia fulva]|nr:Calcium/calmodulin-dependent protein kinase cmkA [Fulvia fulva]KAK4632833.1 Calcium/calmodulin-dependent protein kinase cmkA [Fulvia fulva]WPV11083.1 Calcium/calmodulin-dependent protein kinase cmkA [Fulvia fulva]WPV26040.1 Calcium/calmodulin-dependent protein kinase cmkA [Fulvia fulva]